MVNRLVSVGDDFTLPAAVKAADANLPERLSEPSLSATIATAVEAPIAEAKSQSEAKITLAQAAAQSYTDAKLAAGFNPTSIPGLDCWFDASNLVDGVYGYDTFGRANASSLGTSTSGLAWSQQSGLMSITSNAVKMTSGLNSMATLASVRAADFATEFRFKLSATEGSLFLMPRFSTNSNYIKLVVKKNGSSDYLQIVSVVSNVESQIAIASGVGMTLGATHQVRIEAKGATYRVYLDRVLKMTATDSGSNFTTTTVAGFGFADSDVTSAVSGFYAVPLSFSPLVDGDTISAWPDLGVPDARHFGARTTVASRPVLKTGIQNNLAVARFDGTAQSLATTVPADTAEFTLAAVVTRTSATQGTIVGSAATGGLQWKIRADGKMEILKTNVASIGVSADTVPVGVPVVVGVTYDSAGVFTFYINSRPAGGGTNLQTFTAGTVLAIGSAPGSTELLAGDIGEIVRFTRSLYGAELRQIFGGLASKRGIAVPQRILSGVTSPLVLSRPIKGSSIHPKSTDFNFRPGNGWVGVHGNWDWTWIKRSVDRAVSTGVNTIRLIGDVETVFTGVISQATYLSHIQQLVEYCDSLGVDYYHCGGDATHFGGADGNYFASWMGAQAALLANYDNVIAFEILNEVGNAIGFFPESVLAAWVAQASAQVRANAPGLPITVSDLSTGNSTHVGKVSDWQRLQRFAPYLDFFDFHLYPATPNNLKPWHLAAYELVSDRPFVIGEFGVYRPSRTVADRKSVYNGIRELMEKSPSVLGAMQWAAVNDEYGLYSETGDVLQTDISDEWALFPNTY